MCKTKMVKVEGTMPEGFLDELIEGYIFSLKTDDNAKEKWKLLDKVDIREVITTLFTR